MKKVSIISAEEAALKVQDGEHHRYRRFRILRMPGDPVQGS